MKLLRLSTNITAEFLNQVEIELVPLIYDQLLKVRDLRSGVFYKKIYPFLFACIRPLSVFGLFLILSIYLMEEEFALWHFAGAVFFLLGLLISFYFSAQKMEVRVKKMYQPYWRWLAKRLSKRMLKNAKKIAPFTAEYDLRDNLMIYLRVKDNTPSFVWWRQISGLSCSGNGFTVFFKNHRSYYPFAIILHNAQEELTLQLDGLNL
ncbi:MAG: hypothetical protein V4447_11270 [Pseudomonadota bacterium]